MESREEWRERKLKEAEQASGSPIPGHRSSVVHIGDRYYKAFEPLRHTNEYRALSPVDKTAAFEVPTIVKRTPRARTEHMAARLQKAAQADASGVEYQLLLQRIQSQLWTEGKPVPFDEVLRVAQDIMQKAEKEQQAKFDRMVSH